MDKKWNFTKLSQLMKKLNLVKRDAVAEEAASADAKADTTPKHVAAFIKKARLLAERAFSKIRTARHENKEAAVSFFHSIGGKLLLFVVPVLVVSVAVSVAFAMFNSNAISDRIMNEQMERAFYSFKTGLENQNEAWLEKATDSAVDPNFVREVNSQNAEGIQCYLTALKAGGSDFVFVTDRLSRVIYSTSEYYQQGDTLEGMAYLESAFNGQNYASLMTDPNGDILRIAAVPIQTERSGFIGALVAGCYYNNTLLLEDQKRQHGTDLTVFKGNVRWATTISMNGERITGTEMDPKIADIVLTQKKEYTGQATVVGMPYAVKYAPILDTNGNAVGALFSGLPIGDIQQSQSKAIATNVWITIVLIAVATVGTLIFIRRHVQMPLHKLKLGAEQLADGNTGLTMDANGRKDEVGGLMQSFATVCTSLQAMIADTDGLVQAALAGELKTRADADKHKGDFKKIVEGVNLTLDAVTAPIEEARQVLHELSLGNLNARVTGEFQGDHAMIKHALNETIASLKRYISETSYVLSELSDKNLTVSITSEYRGDFVELKDSINGIVASLNDMLQEIGAAADQVAAGTTQVSAGSQTLSQASVEQASSIEELNATVSELADHTRSNAARAMTANELTAAAQAQAINGNNKMQALQAAMEAINETAGNIRKIIKVIDDIAFQTSLLSLNAAIEAARAGQYGRGFSVVADEVRNLAQKSADAAKETTALINNSIKKAAAGTRIADDTSATLLEITASVEQAAALVKEITQASNDQATGIMQVNSGLSMMSNMVQQNSATAEQSAATAQELSGQAEMLREMVEEFRLIGEEE